jgi:hypothetical protein
MFARVSPAGFAQSHGDNAEGVNVGIVERQAQSDTDKDTRSIDSHPLTRCDLPLVTEIADASGGAGAPVNTSVDRSAQTCAKNVHAVAAAIAHRRGNTHGRIAAGLSHSNFDKNTALSDLNACICSPHRERSLICQQFC